MPRRRLRVRITTRQRQHIDADLMAQTILSIGREWAQRDRAKRESAKERPTTSHENQAPTTKPEDTP